MKSKCFAVYDNEIGLFGLGRYGEIKILTSQDIEEIKIISSRFKIIECTGCKTDSKGATIKGEHREIKKGE